MTNEDVGKCGACGGRAKLKCTACGTVYYCCKEHQKKHWKIHKKECLPYTEECDPLQGRYLVASKDIPAGTLIFNEKPVAVGPAATSFPLCLGCHTPITTPDFPKCPKCSWPLCSPECAMSILHITECGYLATDEKKLGPPVSLEETPRYDIILVLRCLALRLNKPEAWKTIEKMVSHSEKYLEENDLYHTTTVRFITEYLKDICDAKTAHHVRGAIITNAINTRGPHGQTIRGLYPKIYLLNHSCTPNVTLRSDFYSTLYVHSATDIKKGDPLVFSYVPSGAPLWQRQQDLRTIYSFTCKCKRCSDPTELGTNFSNPRCSKCSEGFLEPSENYEMPWKCSKCGATQKLEQIIKQDEEFMEKIQKGCNTPEDASQILQEALKTYHPKHYVWLKAAQTTLGKLSNDTGTESLERRRDLWQQVLHLFLKLEPGWSRRRGVSLFHLACVEHEIVKQEEAAGKYLPQEYLVGLTKVQYILDSSRDILALEPPDSMEKRWLKLVDEEIAKVKKIRESLEEKR